MSQEMQRAIVTISSLCEAIEKAGGSPSIVVSTEFLSSKTALELVSMLASNNITFVHTKEGVTQ